MPQIETYPQESASRITAPTHNPHHLYLSRLSWFVGLVSLVADMALAAWMLGVQGGSVAAVAGAAFVGVVWLGMEIGAYFLISHGQYEVKRRKSRIRALLLIPALALIAVAAILALIGRTIPALVIAVPMLLLLWPLTASIGLVLMAVACFQYHRLYRDKEQLVTEYWHHRSELIELDKLLSEWTAQWGSPFSEASKSLKSRVERIL